jgi:hypothetical protein
MVMGVGSLQAVKLFLRLLRANDGASPKNLCDRVECLQIDVLTMVYAAGGAVGG